MKVSRTDASAYAGPRELVELYFESLKSGDFDRAQKILATIEFKGQCGLRMQIHYRAQLAMEQGEYAQALVDLTKAKENYEPYIGIQVDLATCYHQLGYVSRWLKALDEIADLLDGLKDILEPSRLVRYQIWLAKYLEEDGRVAEALVIYSRLSESHGEFLSPAQAAFLTIQKLRLLAQFRSRKELGLFYKTLHQFDASRFGSDTFMEWRHAIMLTDSSLFGSQHGLARLKAILGDSGVTDRDKSFALADFIVTTGLSRSSLGAQDLSLCVPACGEFEEAAYHYFQHGKLSIESLSSHALALSWANQIRLLALALRGANGKEKEEILKRIRIALSSASKASAPLWREFVELQNQSALDKLEGVVIQIKEGQIGCNDLLLQMRPSRALVKLLQLLIESRRVSTPQALEAITEETYSPALFDRVRMMITRFNREISLVSSERQVIRITKDAIEVSHSVRLIDHTRNKGDSGAA